MTNGTLCHTRGHSHSYLGKGRISQGVVIILSICLRSHNWLDCNQFPIILGGIYTCQYCKSFTCGENFGKKYRAAAKLISNHKLQNNCFVKKCISKHKSTLKLLKKSLKKCILNFLSLNFL